MKPHKVYMLALDVQNIRGPPALPPQQAALLLLLLLQLLVS